VLAGAHPLLSAPQATRSTPMSKTLSTARSRAWRSSMAGATTNIQVFANISQQQTAVRRRRGNGGNRLLAVRGGSRVL